jgi:MFS transporter, UMF1 family
VPPITTSQARAADRRERLGWYAYDWANTAFATTVVTVFLGPYLTAIARAAADADGFVRPLGVPVPAGAVFPYVVSISVLTQIICLPFLGAIADFAHWKKHFLGLFAFIGAGATMGLYLVEGTNYLLGSVLFLIANLSFGASVVFYNAFLPEIAAPKERDAVSANGFAIGWLGAGLLLAACLALFSQSPALGLSQGHAVRISLLAAGVWWAAFTLITLATLRQRERVRRLPEGGQYVTASIDQLRHTLAGLRAYPQTLLFLGAYLLFSDGVETVVTLSSQFGQEELGLSITTLTTVILMVQFVAIVGALGFLKVATITGTKWAVAISLLIWIATVTYAYAFLQTALDFFVLGGVIGLVIGGTQALSRSLFSQMIPHGRESEYFSLYEISHKGTSWLGPLIYGLALQFTGSYRISILSLVILFVLGLLLLLRVDVRAAAHAVGNPLGGAGPMDVSRAEPGASN